MYKDWNPVVFGVWVCAVFYWAPAVGKHVENRARAASEMTYQLPDNVWRQISLPLEPGVGRSINDVLGDDLPSGEYGSSWIVYSFDPQNVRYVRHDLSDDLEPGVGYWILQRTGATALLDVSGTSPQLATPAEEACPESVSDCFKIPLVTAAAGRWNMLGYPFADSMAWKQQVISTDSGACVEGCAPSIASGSDVFGSVGYHYDGISYVVLEDDVPLSAWTGYWVVTLPGAHGTNPRVLLPAFDHQSDPVSFNSEQHLIADQIISIFENGTTEIQYGYAEHIASDQHGITAGRAGFTSATGDMLIVVERYTQLKPGNPLAEYIPELQRLEQVYIDHDYELSEEGANVENLGGLIPAWKQAAEDDVFRGVQDAVTNELYFDPVLNKARALGIRYPLTLLCLYDASIQHGYDGMLQMVSRISLPQPVDGGDELAWLKEFNRIRLDVMENTIVDGERIWSDSTYRLHELEDMRKDGNNDLDPFTMVIEDWEGETFTLPTIN